MLLYLLILDILVELSGQHGLHVVQAVGEDNAESWDGIWGRGGNGLYGKDLKKMDVTKDGVILRGRVVDADAAARGELIHETCDCNGVTGRVLVRGENGNGPRTLTTSIFQTPHVKILQRDPELRIILCCTKS